MQRRHIVLLAVAVTAVSTSAVLIRAADNLGVPALAIAFYRCALASVVLLPLLWFGHRDELRALSDRYKQVAGYSIDQLQNRGGPSGS